MSIATSDLPAAELRSSAQRGSSAQRQSSARSLLARFRQLSWRRPEWWTMSLVVVAWILLLAALQLEPGGGSGAHAHGASRGASTGAGVPSASGLPLGALAHWQLMVVAMMFPLIVPSVRVVAFRSLRRRRHRAVALFLGGYLALWALAGAAVCALLALVPRLGGDWRSEASAGAFLLAACWQQTRWKRRALVACHWTMPLAPTGLRADRDALLFGWRIGRSCCLVCWILMLACTLTGHAVLALLGCAAIGLAERTAWRPNRRLIGVGILGLALAFGPLGLG